MRPASVNEVKGMPIGSIVYRRKNDYWRRSKYKVVVLNGVKLLQNIHTDGLLTIKRRPAWHFEVDE